MEATLQTAIRPRFRTIDGLRIRYAERDDPGAAYPLQLGGVPMEWIQAPDLKPYRRAGGVTSGTGARRFIRIRRRDFSRGARIADATPDGSGRMTMDRDETAGAGTATGQTEVAVIAGGCFWGVEEILRAVPGVIDTQVGYTGGWLENPTYHDTHDSKSGHAEAVRITFDPSVLPYEELLEKWFFRLHDPTTLNRQGNDRGTQYRSAIFPQSEAQREAAERVKARVDASGKWQRPITTTIEPASTWYDAEAYHQDYLRKNPGGYTCHYLRD
jgi:methionine-S-sulfoxide reductase